MDQLGLGPGRSQEMSSGWSHWFGVEDDDERS